MHEPSVSQRVTELHALGVRPGGVLLVHTSFRAVRPIEGGPLGLIRALRAAVGDDGTLVMPTMTDGESVFDPRSTPTCGMGITAETFWRQPGVLRSGHPGGSFAAAGRFAERICAPQPLSPPHGPDSPPGRVHELGGQVLLLGVTHSESTTLHVAEAIARVPYSVSPNAPQAVSRSDPASALPCIGAAICRPSSVVRRSSFVVRRSSFVVRRSSFVVLVLDLRRSSIDEDR